MQARKVDVRVPYENLQLCGLQSEIKKFIYIIVLQITFELHFQFASESCNVTRLYKFVKIFHNKILKLNPLR